MICCIHDVTRSFIPSASPQSPQTNAITSPLRLTPSPRSTHTCSYTHTRYNHRKLNAIKSPPKVDSQAAEHAHILLHPLLHPYTIHSSSRTPPQGTLQTTPTRHHLNIKHPPHQTINGKTPSAKHPTDPFRNPQAVPPKSHVETPSGAGRKPWCTIPTGHA